MAEERMDPVSARPASFWEHAYRYRFAAQYVRGRRVLDLACGEGYGTAALRRAGARSVVGLDISWQVCRRAGRKYAGSFCAGDAQVLPFADRSFDLIVSFETIEHIERPDVFLDECVRVLLPKGLLVVSTPNKAVHRESAERNPCHRSEMYEEEFFSLVSSRFRHTKRYLQLIKTAPWWSPRSLAATHARWVRIKGGWRARQWMRSLLCPHILHTPEEVDRHSAVEAILSKDGLFASWVNPYRVRPRSGTEGERPWYLIALCHD